MKKHIVNVTVRHPSFVDDQDLTDLIIRYAGCHFPLSEDMNLVLEFIVNENSPSAASIRFHHDYSDSHVQAPIEYYTVHGDWCVRGDL